MTPGVNVSPRARRGARRCASALYRAALCTSHESRLFRMILSLSLSLSLPPLLCSPLLALLFLFLSLTHRCIDRLRCSNARAKNISFTDTQETIDRTAESETSDYRLKRTLITRSRSSNEYFRDPNQEFRRRESFSKNARTCHNEP